jgi:hypothetical protein
MRIPSTGHKFKTDERRRKRRKKMTKYLPSRGRPPNQICE